MKQFNIVITETATSRTAPRLGAKGVPAATDCREACAVVPCAQCVAIAGRACALLTPCTVLRLALALLPPDNGALGPHPGDAGVASVKGDTAAACNTRVTKLEKKRVEIEKDLEKETESMRKDALATKLDETDLKSSQASAITTKYLFFSHFMRYLASMPPFIVYGTRTRTYEALFLAVSVRNPFLFIGVSPVCFVWGGNNFWDTKWPVLVGAT